jgi:hypothetical protein
LPDACRQGKPDNLSLEFAAPAAVTAAPPMLPRHGQELGMLYKLGRVLQLIGLILLPVAMAGNAAERLTLKDMLLLSAAGMLAFFIGWLLQQSSKQR